MVASNNMNNINMNINNINNNNHGDKIYHYYHLHDKKLGEGGFAKVCLATHLATRQYVAIKCLDKIQLGPELPRIYNEIECLKRLKHRNIARLYQVFETDTMIYLVLEHCPGGELFDYIVSKNRLSEPEAAQILFDLMRVLDFIHINGFAHRDLKPENVLFDDKHQIKLIDFGLAANCSADNMAQNDKQPAMDMLSTCCGSVTYAAPEVIAGNRYSGTLADVWSAGVMLYALLVGQLPFNDNSIPKLYQKIQAGIKSLPSFLSPEASDLIRKMLTIDPQERVTVREILDHPWLRNRSNTHAKISRRLNFNGNRNQLDEQLLERCCEKFPHLTMDKLKELIKEDFNYYSTAYYLMQAKCPPRTFAVQRMTPERIMTTMVVAAQSPPRTPRPRAPPPPVPPRTPVHMPLSAFVYNTPTTPKKSVVKRLLESATPGKLREKRLRKKIAPNTCVRAAVGGRRGGGGPVHIEAGLKLGHKGAGEAGRHWWPWRLRRSNTCSDLASAAALAAAASRRR